jgi:hypothetical protein
MNREGDMIKEKSWKFCGFGLDNYMDGRWCIY